jgi:hypothetical protein
LPPYPVRVPLLGGDEIDLNYFPTINLPEPRRRQLGIAHRVRDRTCCRHYPGAAAGRITSLVHPDVSACPERVVGSACASSFSRLARRSLALWPAHSRCHQFVTRIPKASAISSPPQLLRLLPAGAVAGWDLHPLVDEFRDHPPPGGKPNFDTEE